MPVVSLEIFSDRTFVGIVFALCGVATYTQSFSFFVCSDLGDSFYESVLHVCKPAGCRDDQWVTNQHWLPLCLACASHSVVLHERSTAVGDPVGFLSPQVCGMVMEVHVF